MNIQDKSYKNLKNENLPQENMTNENLIYSPESVENTKIEPVNNKVNFLQKILNFWKSLGEIIQLIKFIDEEEPGRH